MMKHTLLYIPAAALALSAALASCDDNFTHPPVIMPPCVDVVPNATIADIKADYWGNLGSPTEIGYKENGDTIIFTGRVCSSDETGNIYKSLVIQTVDENGEQLAINFSVNSYDIYQLFPIGQEVAVYASGLSIGGYRNLLQFGAVSGSEMTFMDPELFKAHVIRNHMPLPEPAKIDTTVTTIPEVIAAKSDNAQLQRWQSRLIRINDVSWVEAGQPFAGSSSVSRYITDADGNRLVVRNSSYASFKNEIIPGGTGSVTAILSYYNNDWQLLLNGTDGLEGFTPIEPVAPVDPAGAGTADDPYNVSRALEIIASGSIPAENVYMKGIITAVSEIDTSFGNATYTIADQEMGEGLIIFRGYWLNGEKFTSTDQLAKGAEVIVYGKMMSYNGTPEVAQGNQLYSYNGTTGNTPAPEPTPDPTPAGTTLYSMLGESLTELPADWTIDDGTLPEGLTYIWSWKVYQNAGYLNASAFLGSAFASEAYAISPVIDLTGVTGAGANFDHAAKFQTTLLELCGFAVREEGATEWTALKVPTWPAAGAWTFANSGNIDLSAYDGKKIQVAFKYGSTAAGADTWEIKNLAITGTK